MGEMILVHSADIYHHGVKGQSWGKRQYQYEDGSLTPLGREHYGVGDNDKKAKKIESKLAKKNAKVDKLYSKAYNQEMYGMKNLKRNVDAYNKSVDEVNEYIDKKIKPKYLIGID